MRPADRLPVLTEVLQLGQPPAAQPGEEPAASAPPAAAADKPPAEMPAAQWLPVSDQMARAVLELELEQALREVLEPRLSVLLRETASELALRLEPRMRQWLRDRGTP